MIATNAQQSTAEVLAPGGGSALLRVERAWFSGGWVLISGWTTAGARLQAVADSTELISLQYERRYRADVSKAVNDSSGSPFGFALLCQSSFPDQLGLKWEGTADGIVATIALEEKPTLESFLDGGGDDDRRLLLTTVDPFTPEWKTLASKISAVTPPPQYLAANIEFVAIESISNNGFLSGWIIAEWGRDILWAQVGETIFPLDRVFRRKREDVAGAFPGVPKHLVDEPGFVAPLLNASVGANVKIRCQHDGVIYDLSERGVTVIQHDPKQVAEMLFSTAPSSPPAFNLYCRTVVRPILEPLQKRSSEEWRNIEPQKHNFGVLPSYPLVSIIVPLYGRVDFVEHQLMEFSKDEWLLDNAEIIYVVDDPKLLAEIRRTFHTLEVLYEVPFVVVWGGVNRGFSGANNLGAAFARGAYYLFLNSDVFPKKPEWLRALIEFADGRDSFGAVVPRLTFADGSLQHAGMKFRYRPDLEIYVNEHPLMGLAPSLDKTTEPVEVEAATGACILTSKENYGAIGGWDEGYLVGDFEDSDFCLSLKRSGLNIYYHPGVELTHLERQSFSMLGEQGFRQQVTIYNALRHEDRWFEGGTLTNHFPVLGASNDF